MSSPRISITEIAQKAGTSTATVSRVLNHPELVNQATAQLIRNAMEELQYSPRTTKKVTSRRLVLINVPDFTNPFYGEVIKGITTSLNSHGFSSLIDQSDLLAPGVMDTFTNLARSTHASGLVLCSHLGAQQYHRLASLAPLVQCCEYNSDAFPYVSIDDFQSAYNAVKHIYTQGRKKIAFVNGPAEFKYARERKRGYDAFLSDAGLEKNESWSVNLPEIDYDMAFAAIRQLLTSATPPDAIFTSSDLLAAAAIRAAKSLRIHVPQELVVVGFDNINISTICDPTITTVSQPRFQLGYTAGEIIYDQITALQPRKQQVLLNTELIIRESSAAAPRYMNENAK